MMSDDLRSGDFTARRLAALQADADDAYTAITAADAALRALAERRVAAEQVLRGAAAHHQAAAAAAAAESRARPRLLRRLTTGLRADRAWSRRLAALDTLRAEAEPSLTAATDTLAQVKDEFAAQVRARAEAVTALRAATTACTLIQEELRSGLR